MTHRSNVSVLSILCLSVALGCGGGTDEGDGAPYKCPEASPVIACEAGATIDSAMDVDALLASEDGVASFDGAIQELVCASWAASGRPLVQTPRLSMLPQTEFEAARDTHPVFKGRAVPGFIVHDPGAPEGQEECIVLPTTWPAAEFVEVMQHEVGHVRQAERGEQEAELAEIVQALSTAQLHPKFGARLLEAIFDIKVGHPPNVIGHAHALVTLTANGGDFAAAHAGLAGWTDDKGEADLKTACGCDDPQAEGRYEGFAAPFVDAISGFTAVPGAAQGEALVDIQAFLRWRLAFALNEIDGGGRDFMPVVDATSDYILARDTPGLYHAWVTRAATQILAAAATPAEGTPPEVPVRIGHWKRIIELNATYLTQDGDDDAERFDQYLRAYSASAGWASAAAPPDGATVTFMSDTFLARHGETPAGACEAQVAAEVFQRRGGFEFAVNVNGGACDAEPWFKRSKALLGWADGDDCTIAMEGIGAFVDGELEKIATHNCEG